jgi:chromosome segregation ATPase
MNLQKKVELALVKTSLLMKIIPKYLSIALFLLVGCGKSAQHEHQDQDDDSDNSPNQALYDQVMDIHNEVMPKSDEIYNLKKEIKDKLTSTPDLSTDKKEKLNQIVAELDSADHSMMDWMHKFKPLPDSANQELAREYLENEMERIKTVRELINGSLQKAKEELGKK